MPTVSTSNVSATNDWSLVRTASSAESVSLSFVGAPIEVATNLSSTAPADTVRGHRVTAEGTVVTLANNERLWVREARNITISETPQVVYTVGD